MELSLKTAKFGGYDKAAVEAYIEELNEEHEKEVADLKEKVEKIVIEEMQRAITLAVPLVADSGFGQNWLEAH